MSFGVMEAGGGWILESCLRGGDGRDFESSFQVGPHRGTGGSWALLASRSRVGP